MTLSMRLGSSVAVAAMLTVSGLAVLPAEAHTTGIHDNCTNFNKRYPHGVGTRNARGWHKYHFNRSNRMYWRAERHNGDLDRDNDRIACEKP